jgi:hypothetical protein
VVASIALVGGLLLEPGFPAAAVEVEDGSPTDAEILELPLEGSDAAGEVLPEPSTPDSTDPALAVAPVPSGAPSPSEVGAADAAEEFEAPVRESELPDASKIIKQDMFNDTYDLGEGVRLTHSSAEPMNVKRDGQWREISTDVQGVGFWSFLGFGEAEVVDHPLSPRFAESATSDQLLRVSAQGHDVSYALEGAADSPLQRNLGFGEKNRVEYPGVFDSTTLVYDVENAGVKQFFRLDAAPGGQGRSSWTWKIDTDGLELVETEDGVVEFRDAAGEAVLVLPPLQAWDSAGETGANAGTQANVSVGLDTIISGSGSEWEVTVRADRDWLNDEDRVYPVWVDPLWQYTNGVDRVHAYKSNGQYTYNYGLKIGNTNTNGIWRTVAHYPYEQFFGKQVLDVNLSFSDPTADSTVTNRLGELYWANAFSYNGIGHSLGALSTDHAYGWVDDDRLTQQIVDWVNTRGPDGYLMHRGDESNAFTYKMYNRANMITVWKDFPTPGGLVAPSPSNGGYGGEVPTLKIGG